ncbi:MAG: hypothetical protein M3135_07445 [Actinomycetota bacterium]|nr:hypothetical protein [Actinomycetota bacterium]
MPAVALGALSALRGRRVFHPVGVAYRARCHVAVGDPQILPPGDHDAVVRFSRGAGLPTSLPDVLGIAVKLHGLGHDDGDQDFLLASSASPPGVRRLLLPRRGFPGRRFSSILAYRFDGHDPILIGALLWGPESRLDDPQRAPRLPGGVIHIEAAGRFGDWRGVGRLDIGERLPLPMSDELRFDPWATSDALVPTGLLNAVRAPAYRASQFARLFLGWRQADPKETDTRT